MIKYLILATVLAGCSYYRSGEDTVYVRRKPAKPPVDWAAVQPVIDKVCQKCHASRAPSLANQAEWEASNACDALKNQRMPPSGPPRAEDLQLLLQGC